jgi:predicted dehydrogenase
MRKHRAVIVGAGGWSRAWGATLRDNQNVDVTGWVDLQPGLAERAAHEIGFDSLITGTDLDEVIAAAHPDFILNVTVPSAHCDVSVHTLEAGFPVLCEKPMASDMDQARKMVAASERTGKLLMISQQRTHDPKIVATRQLITETLGTLGLLDSAFYMGHPEATYHRNMANALLLDMAVHTFDAARYLAAADPLSVYCEGFNPPWSWHTSNSSALAIFEMTGGLRYVYRGTWASHGWNTTWEALWRAMGRNGTVIWDGESPAEAEIVAEPGFFPPVTRRIQAQLDPNAPGPVAASLNDFLSALETGETPIGECHDNIKTLAMVFGALESIKSGQRISIEQVL